MHRQVGRHRLVDLVEELAELDRTMLWAGLMHDLAGGQVERGEQVGDSVAFVVMGSSLDLAGAHR